eukprot:gene4426-biopygen4145
MGSLEEYADSMPHTPCSHALDLATASLLSHPMLSATPSAFPLRLRRHSCAAPEQVSVITNDGRHIVVCSRARTQPAPGLWALRASCPSWCGAAPRPGGALRLPTRCTTAPISLVPRELMEFD